MKKILLSIVFTLGIIGFSNINACETCGCKNNKDAALQITEESSEICEKTGKVCPKTCAKKEKGTCCQSKKSKSSCSKSSKKSSCSKSNQDGFNFNKSNNYGNKSSCSKEKSKKCCKKKAAISDEEATVEETKEKE